MSHKTLKELRMQAGKSILQVASELHTKVKIIAEYEQGKRGLGILRTMEIAKSYGCSMEEVVKAQKLTGIRFGNASDND